MKPIRLVINFVLLFIVGSIVGIAVYVYVAPHEYLAFVVSGDPVILVLIKPKGEKITILSIPGDTYIEGVHGYGMYSLSALWKLGTIDKRSGTLLIDSLSETLGVPITRYVGSQLAAASEPLSAIKELMSWNHIPAFLTHRYVTNMNFSEFVSVVKRVSSARTSEVETIDVGKSTLFENKSLPDGSVVSEVDPDRIDPIIGDAFENEEIRQEAKRIAVVNTTETAGLGTRVAKMLSHIGAVVVSVSNAAEPIDRCVIEVSEKNKTSGTAAFIRSYYDCDIKIGEESDRADIRLLVGRGYRARFMESK